MKGMEKIELAIKIPKAYYDMVIERCKDPVLLNAFKNGTVLTKGHLIDADKTISKICGNKCGCHLEECGYDKPCYPVEIIKSASTIIEDDYNDEDDGKAIVIEPKDNTVGSSLSSIIDTYVKVSEENGLTVHKIVVDDSLVYWDSEETLNKWEAEGEE